MKLIDLKGRTRAEMEEFAESAGESKFRGSQLFRWIYSKGAGSFDEMSDIGKKLKEKLSRVCYISALKTLEIAESESKNADRYLFELEDGNTIESVLMRYDEQPGGRCTVCISSQAGCAQGCRFCASGQSGFVRNLTVGEIVDQIIQIRKHLENSGEKVHNVVIMGIGEPLVNYDNVVGAVRLMNDCDGLAVGMRKIALSTVGIPPLIRKLAEEKLSIRFAVSLHAPDNRTRSMIMPVNDKYPVEEVMDACRYYQKLTGRRITVEYTLIDGVNDSVQQAEMLGKILEGMHVMVNLIPLNPVKGFPYTKPSINKCERFSSALEKFRFHAPLRVERGVSINAACGQLRMNRINKSNQA